MVSANNTASKRRNPKTQFKTSARNARANVREMGAAAGRLARDQVDHLVEGVSELRASVESKVEERPMRSMLIAAGTGAILGFLIARRR